MSFSIPESVYDRQRCRQWSPLFTQQLRLRHLQQVMVYNIKPFNKGKFYFTLHLSALCSPFYTSDEVPYSRHQKWANLDFRNTTYSSVSVFVIRIWQKRDTEMDITLLSWGVNLTGLVYLGNKLSEIQSESFIDNTVIFHLQGGFFTSHITLRSDLQKPFPFIDSLNLVSDENSTKVFRHVMEKLKNTEVKSSYSVNKLQKLHSLQIYLKNKHLDVQQLSEKISAKCGMCSYESNSGDSETSDSESSRSFSRHTSHLLTMNTLNRMLYYQEKPTKEQIRKIINTKKEIEVKQFRTKLLLQERDKKSARLKSLKQNLLQLTDDNQEKESRIMDNYRQLNRDIEKLKEWKRDELHLKGNFQQITMQLHHRQRQLMMQLLDIYPIYTMSDQKYWIYNVSLPNSDMLSDCSDSSLPVALGYVAHVLLMCSSFLQVPLRYPITYFGSRSYITDHITCSLIDRDKDFPLYTRGKDRMQFTYAVYLLNKNIAQLRWLCSLHTPNLRATLSNLLSLLQRKDNKPSFRSVRQENLTTSSSLTSAPKLNDTENCNSFQICKNSVHSAEHDTRLAHPGSLLSNSSELLHQKPFGFVSNKSDPVIDALRHEYNLERSRSPTRRSANVKKAEKGSNQENPGLSQILSIPEAFLNKQISSTDFKTYLSKNNPGSNVNGKLCTEKNGKVEEIEQGTDIINSNDLSSSSIIKEKTPIPIRISNDICTAAKMIKQNRRKSRSVGSFTEDEEDNLGVLNSFEVGSDPLINISFEKEERTFNIEVEASKSIENMQQEFLQQWLNNSSLISSNEAEGVSETMTANIPPKSSVTLSERTDALLSKTSFNLVKPK